MKKLWVFHKIISLYALQNNTNVSLSGYMAKTNKQTVRTQKSITLLKHPTKGSPLTRRKLVFETVFTRPIYLKCLSTYKLSQSCLANKEITFWGKSGPKSRLVRTTLSLIHTNEKLVHPTGWSSGNAFVSGARGLRFKSWAGQIRPNG